MTDTTWPPPWTLKSVHDGPETLRDTGEGADDDIHWAVSWGFALNINCADHDDPASPLTIGAHFSGADLARGFVKRQVTPEQLERFALLLMAKAARYRQEAAR